MQMEVYLDNSATTRVHEDVITLMEKVMREDYGNPSSKHRLGFASEQYLRDARRILADILQVAEKEIIFTSGGTESNNMALIGAALANQRRGRHIIASGIEHPSVLEPLRYLEKLSRNPEENFQVTYLPVDRAGHISLTDLEHAMRPDTILVSVMCVNNETGAIQPVAQIGNLIRQISPSCLFHVDAIQAFGKMKLFPKKQNIDLLSVSSHKFHGPKGAGFLYKNEKVKVQPLILGGGQQKGMRSGTDNVPGIAGMAEAARIAYRDLETNTAHMTQLKDYMIAGLRQMSQELGQEDPHAGKYAIKLNSLEGSEGAPHIVSCTFFPVKSEVMLHALEEKGIYVSSGSACSSNKPGLSGTLQAIGLSAKEADCTIRFSFCESNTKEEIDYTLAQVKQLYHTLKRFTSH